MREDYANFAGMNESNLHADSCFRYETASMGA